MSRRVRAVFWNKIKDEAFHLRATGHYWTAPTALVREVGTVIVTSGRNLARVYAIVKPDHFGAGIQFDDGTDIPPVILELLKKMIVDHFVKIINETYDPSKVRRSRHRRSRSRSRQN